MRALLIVLALALTGCANAPDWRPYDTRREVVYQLVNAADAWQTAQIQHRADLVEVGPMARSLMGAEPSDRDVAIYFTSMAVSHYVISRILPPKWRSWWQNTTLLYHSSVVYENCSEHDLC